MPCFADRAKRCRRLLHFTFRADGGTAGPERGTHANADAYAYADPHAYADPDADAYADPFAYAFAYADANPDAYSHSHTVWQRTGIRYGRLAEERDLE